MKCINCGGDYAVTARECPYCQTQNHEGMRRSQEKDHKKDFFHALRLQTILEAGPGIVTKTLTRILLACIGFFILTIVLVIVFFAIRDINLSQKLDMKQHVINLDAIKASGEYQNLSSYLGDHSLSRYDGVEEYWQLHYLNEDFIYYRIYRDKLQRMTSEEVTNGDSKIQTLIERSCALAEYGHEFNTWSQLFEGNQEIYDDYMEEVRLGLMVTCQLTAAEVEELFSFTAGYYSHCQPFIPLVKERMMVYASDK